MDTKGYDAGMDGLHRDEGARRELEGDSQGEPAGNEDDEKHTAHSTLQSSSETILEEAQELSNFAERAFPREAQGQDPIAAPQSNDDANEAFQAYQVHMLSRNPTKMTNGDAQPGTKRRKARRVLWKTSTRHCQRMRIRW
jgi:hypothetical protein